MTGRRIIHTVLLICGIMELIERVYLLECPYYIKQDAVNEGRLKKKALCRASKYKPTEIICLNGLIPPGSNCETSNCTESENNNCETRCLTDDDYGIIEPIEFNTENCIDDELIKFCQLFNNGNANTGMYELFKSYAKIKCDDKQNKFPLKLKLT